MKIALLGQFASMKIFIFILVYLKDLRVISPDVLSTATYGYQTAIAFGLNSSGGHRGANDLVSEIFRHVTGHHSSVRNQNFGRPGHRSHWRPNCSKWYSTLCFRSFLVSFAQSKASLHYVELRWGH